MMRRLFVVVCVIVTFIIFVYPRPFKESELGYLLPDKVDAQNLEFAATGLFRGCQIEVYSIEKQSFNVKELAVHLGSLGSEIEPLFSQWLPELNGILLETSYYNTLDFDECTEALQESYKGLNWNELISNENGLSLFRIGGMTNFSIPLSHADTIIIATSINNDTKLIMLKGGK